MQHIRLDSTRRPVMLIETSALCFCRRPDKRPDSSQAALRVTYPPINVKGGQAAGVAETRNHSFLIDARGKKGIARRDGNILTGWQIKRSNDSFGRTDKSVGAAVVAVRARNRSFVVDAGRRCQRAYQKPAICGKTVTKVPGTSKVSKIPSGRRTKPKLRTLATV